MREEKLTQCRVKRKPVDTLTGCVDKNRAGTIYDVTCGNLGPTFLQEIFVRDAIAQTFLPVDGKYRADVDIDIDIGRTIQRIHHK